MKMQNRLLLAFHFSLLSACEMSTAPATSSAGSSDLTASVQIEVDGYVRSYELGKHYAAAPSAASEGRGFDSRVSVTEFFMYSCSHCFSFEPYIKDWLSKKPDDVTFERVPVVWNDESARLQARLYYTIEVLGKTEEMHEAVFVESHVNHRPLDDKASMALFFGRFDVEQERFEHAFQSADVTEQVRRAEAASKRNGISRTPSLVINGRYVTSPRTAGGNEEAVQLAARLVEIEASEDAPRLSGE